MKLLRFIGLAAAAAMLFAFPAVAAVSPGAVLLDQVQATPSVNDCLASFDQSAVMVFAPAEQNCDVTMAELTGLCLVRSDPATVPSTIVAVFDPALDVTCTSIRPSPPG